MSQPSPSNSNSPNRQGTYFADWPAAALKITGGDRLQFLQNMCTADVRQLEPGSGCETFFTNVKGHVLAHAWLAASADAVEVVLFQDDSAPLAAHLDRYLIRDDAQIAPASRPVLVVFGGQESDNELPSAEAVGRAPFGLLGAGAWLLRTAEGEPPDADQLAAWHLSEGSREAFDALRIEAGWPLQGVDFTDRTLPQELSRDHLAISFTKGCYLGQETVARLDALGHVNKQLRVVRLTGELPQSLPAELFDGDRQVGTLTSAAHSNRWQAPLALAMIRRGSNAPGTRLTTSAAEAEVLDLPATG